MRDLSKIYCNKEKKWQPANYDLLKKKFRSSTQIFKNQTKSAGFLFAKNSKQQKDF